MRRIQSHGDAPKDGSPQFLSGWKDIAAFLGKGIRTVQRYEREMGLPVRRPAGAGTRGSVVALTAEVDAWVKASPIREALPLRSVAQNRYPAQQLHRGLSELAILRDQMAMLRAELKASVQRLRNSLNTIQAELTREAPGQHRTKRPSSMYSENEGDLLERSISTADAIQGRKAS